MTGPELVPADALVDVDVGLSVSDSADLRRLGLDPRHAELAIGEIARAVLVAGGRLTYGGRIRPSGFTQQLMNEIQRYGTTRPSLTLCLALPEHRKLDLHELKQVDDELASWGNLVALDADGKPMSWKADRQTAGSTIADEGQRRQAYSALREFITTRTAARVLVGGQLSGYQGAMPGLIEEAILAVRHGRPLYLAGGFGGAAAAIGKSLEIDSFQWMPADLPLGHNDDPVAGHLARLRQLADTQGWTMQANGLTDDESRLLAASHRPGEIASLIIVGLARILGGRSPR